MENLSPTEMLELLMATQRRDPGNIYWSLRRNNPPGRPPPATEQPTWCVCANCQEMNTDVENLCCGQRPEQCTSREPHMDVYILEEGVLTFAVGIWNDVRAQVAAANHNDRNRQYRHAAYRQFVWWQYGVLGAGNRVVVFSCCVIRIRSRFPDSNAHYVGWLPSRV